MALTDIPDGKRAQAVKVRNDAIVAAAVDLAKAGDWPSPAAIAERTGISESVVKREKDRLTPAKRTWVRVIGHDHPQWKDPDGPMAADGGGADDGAAGVAVDLDPAAVAAAAVKAHDKAVRDKETAKARRRQIRDLKRRVAVADELTRRQNLGVRPAEIAAILKAGAKNGASGEPDKGVGVGAG
jgi:hypothetical protein